MSKPNTHLRSLRVNIQPMPVLLAPGWSVRPALNYIDKTGLVEIDPVLLHDDQRVADIRKGSLHLYNPPNEIPLSALIDLLRAAEESF